MRDVFGREILGKLTTKLGISMSSGRNLREIN